jgi:hypothetical protein
MTPLGVIPPGMRLDAWPAEAKLATPADSPEVAQLREELRKTMPEITSYLDLLAKLRPLQDLAGQLAAPQPAKLIIQRS